MMQEISRPGKRAHQQRASLAEGVLNRRRVPIRMLPSSFPAVQIVVLPEVSAIYIASIHFKHQLVGDVGIKLDELLPCAKQLIEAEVWLYRSHVTAVAKICRQSFAYQGPAILHIFL